MTRTIDVVIVGADPAAIAAIIDAARKGHRVLVVIRSTSAGVTWRLRRALRSAQSLTRSVQIVTGAEIACVDGVHSIEAVVVRHLRTGRLTGFNAARLLHFAEETRSC